MLTHVKTYTVRIGSPGTSSVRQELLKKCQKNVAYDYRYDRAIKKKTKKNVHVFSILF